MGCRRVDGSKVHWRDSNAAASINNLENQPAAKFEGITVNEADRSSVSYGVTLKQLIFDFGASGSIYRTAKNSREIKRLAADLTKNTVVLNFISAYFDLLESEKMLQVAEKEKEQKLQQAIELQKKALAEQKKAQDLQLKELEKLRSDTGRNFFRSNDMMNFYRWLKTK